MLTSLILALCISAFISPSASAQSPEEMQKWMEAMTPSDVHKMMGMIQKLKNRVACDDLTGLLRRDEFFHRLETMSAQAHGGAVSVILVDIDNFKSINDTEGHLVGDHVLHRVAKVIKRCIRAGAEVGRFGGEEFILAL
ncbi:MAG: hypothetical protein B7Z54_01235, partial [Sphingobacteriales bacterium 12-47-4]